MIEQKKMSVLVVDDDDNWRPLLVTLLNDEFVVDNEANYDNALHRILSRKIPYHVIVTDIRYVDEEKENEDGLRLVEQLNRLGEYTKSIVITGYPSIDTAKRAVGRLAAFDYLEKFPASGEFDIAGFQSIVRKAATEAERQRPHGFVAPNLQVLLIEPNQDWRNRLVEILRNSPYKVDEMASTEGLADKLRNGRNEYQLIIFDETVPAQSFDFFDILQQYLPEAKKIMFTVQDFGEIVNLIQDHAIMNVFTMSGRGDTFDARDFQKTVHSAFAAEATKYAAINIYEQPNTDRTLREVDQLSVGKSYLLALSLQNDRQPGTTSIWLAQRPDKRGRIRLETFIFAAKTKLNPGTEAYWDIRISELPQPLMTEITPMEVGKLKISIELKSNNIYLGTVIKEVEIVGK